MDDVVADAEGGHAGGFLPFSLSRLFLLFFYHLFRQFASALGMCIAGALVEEEQVIGAVDQDEYHGADEFIPVA